MESSSSLSEDKKRNSSKIINIQVLEKDKEEKYDPPTKNLDIINKNCSKNDNHSNNTGKIIKAKKINEFEKKISEKNIEKSIKSLYIIKNIFSFISEIQKLKIIIYNKNLQKKLDINIENYKRIRGVYREGERNGKGKEYYFYGKLIFEGEYLNGKRNGKGKEYYKNGKIKFKGEYLNGIRWKGKGYDTRNNVVYDIKNGRGLIKEYNKYNSIIFEGEYNNGEKNGKGKEYYYDGKLNVLKYEGEYLNGKKNGKGKEYNQDGELIFEGDYLYGFRLKGKEYINNRVEFEGEFLYGKKWNGKEYDESDNEIYEIINGNIKGKKDDINERLILKNIFIYNKFENYLI